MDAADTASESVIATGGSGIILCIKIYCIAIYVFYK